MTEQEVKETYKVDIEVLRTHSYIIKDMNSQEEAEDLAREIFDDEDYGEMSSPEIYNVDSYPIDPEEDN